MVNQAVTVKILVKKKLPQSPLKLKLHISISYVLKTPLLAQRILGWYHAQIWFRFKFCAGGIPKTRKSLKKVQNNNTENFACLVWWRLTPSFQPPSTMTPITHTVVQHNENVASNPVIKFPVAMIRIGQARHSPITIPYIALFTSN